VSVEINNESGMPADEDALRELAQYVIGQMETHPLADLSMLLVDEAHMTNLHEKWMEEPGPTDVLSFPMDELRPHSMAGPNRSRGRDGDEPEPVLLGDVVLCPQVAAVQARQHGHSTQAELELLTVHGVLHLLGYDHADPEEEAEMFGLQNELLRDWRLESAGRASSAATPTPAEPATAEAATAEPTTAEPTTTRPDRRRPGKDRKVPPYVRRRLAAGPRHRADRSGRLVRGRADRHGPGRLRRA
jgi:probable rRNA maturation factor